MRDARLRQVHWSLQLHQSPCIIPCCAGARACVQERDNRPGYQGGVRQEAHNAAGAVCSHSCWHVQQILPKVPSIHQALDQSISHSCQCLCDTHWAPPLDDAISAHIHSALCYQHIACQYAKHATTAHYCSRASNLYCKHVLHLYCRLEEELKKKVAEEEALAAAEKERRRKEKRGAGAKNLSFALDDVGSRFTVDNLGCCSVAHPQPGV